MQTATADLETMILQGATLAQVLRAAAGYQLEAMGEAPSAAGADAATVRPGAR